MFALQGQHPIHVREHDRVLQLSLDLLEALQFGLQGGIHGSLQIREVWRSPGLQKSEDESLLSGRVVTATAQGRFVLPMLSQSEIRHALAECV